MNTDRGPMHACTHTNREWYGATGCRACERELEAWNQRQERAKPEAARIEMLEQGAEKRKKGQR